MIATAHAFIVAAAEVSHEFVPADDWRTIIALPAGILFFFGSVYLLLRSNLGTRRAYLVIATSFFGFMLILSLFWAFGAPGTPIATGPQNLPGQELDYYQPTWFPFAPDSELAQNEYPLVQMYPEGFEAVDPEDEELVDLTTPLPDELLAFFTEERAGVPGPILSGWEPTGDPQVATAADGTLVAALTFAPPPPQEGGDDATDPATDPEATDDEAAATDDEAAATDDAAADTEAAAQQEPFTAFAFYDPGFILLPSFIMIGISLVGFVLHALLLGWDENRRKEEESAISEEEELQPERVPARA